MKTIEELNRAAFAVAKLTSAVEHIGLPVGCLRPTLAPKGKAPEVYKDETLVDLYVAASGIARAYTQALNSTDDSEA